MSAAKKNNFKIFIDNATDHEKHKLKLKVNKNLLQFDEHGLSGA